jgi:hypothetical protein
VEINPTKHDIKCGKARDPLRCPLARALRRLTGNTWAVDATLATRLIDGLQVRLPKQATAFITAFDVGRAVSPIRFLLDLPANHPCSF